VMVTEFVPRSYLHGSRVEQMADVCVPVTSLTN
jgi:hypothetical protein